VPELKVPLDSSASEETGGVDGFIGGVLSEAGIKVSIVLNPISVDSFETAK
jgi:hypothetical protein